MTDINPQHAIRLAAWIYATHPKLFNKVLAQANQTKVAASKTANIGGLGCAACGGANVSSLGAYRASRAGRLRGLSDITADVSLQPIDLSGVGGSTTDAVSSALTDTGSATGGFWSSLGSGLTNLGSDVLSGIGSVGSYLTSGTGLSNLTSLANTYFAGQAVQAQANTQQAVLQAQVARTAQGYSPAPVTYQRNAAGQLVPVYQSATGYSPLTTQGIAALSGGGSLPSWLPWVAGGALGLVILMKVL